MKKNLTKTSAITSKYQTVIPAQIRKLLNIKQAGELLWHISHVNGRPLLFVAPKTRDWAEYLTGLGSQVWKGVDTDEYLRNIRKEWQT